ncbi:hypothetical protein ACHAWF_001627 [Thalassiosira exigua]
MGRMTAKKNAPRFLDYRRSPLPLDVALCFALPASSDHRVARELILSEKVRVNNAVETSCSRLVCRYDDRISVADHGAMGEETPVLSIAMPRYFLCYKPRGVLCSSRRNDGIDREESVLLSEWFADFDFGGNDGLEVKQINSVGRLDMDSEGLLLLTNDGSFSRLLCDPEFGLRKTYRVVVRGSGYSRMTATLPQCDHDKNNREGGGQLLHSSELAGRIVDMIQRGNDESKSCFPYESCKVLDAGKLPSQHTSDDSYYAIVKIILREGKRHAIRRLIKHAGGGLRVCYLSRVAIEGLEGVYTVAKPQSIVEAQAGKVLPDNEDQTVAPAAMMSPINDGNGPIMLHPGHVIELRGCDVDRIFDLRR